MGSLPGALTIVLYLTAAWLAGRAAFDVRDSKAYRWPAVAAVVCHALSIGLYMTSERGLNFGIFNAASVVAWVTAGSILATSFRTRIEALSALLFVLAGVTVALEILFQTSRVLTDLPPGLLYHIVLALIAYGLFVVACAEAGLLIYADRRMRAHHPVMHALPPLAEMERALFQVLFIAFSLLTYSLILGALYVTNLSEQHLYHKVVFAALAWVVFAVLFFGRWRFGWRGVHAARYVLAGMVLLLLSYFGSKSVLELILKTPA